MNRFTASSRRAFASQVHAHSLSSRGSFYPFFIRGATFLHPSKLLECLPGVEIGSHVVRVGGNQRLELAHGRFQVTILRILHRQTITGEAVVRVLFGHLAQSLETIS